MQTWEEDEFFRAVSDVLDVLEHVNIDDLAYQLVKNDPKAAENLSLAIGFHLIDKELAENAGNN